MHDTVDKGAGEDSPFLMNLEVKDSDSNPIPRKTSMNIHTEKINFLSPLKHISSPTEPNRVPKWKRKERGSSNTLVAMPTLSTNALIKKRRKRSLAKNSDNLMNKPICKKQKP